jgi:hypothetical protein
MSSAIASIYDAIATWTPTYDSDVTIPVENYNQVNSTFKDANAPVRKLMFGPSPAELREGAFITLGKLQGVNWTIHDYLYLKATASGVGYAEVSGKLLLYIASYDEQVRQNRAPTTQSSIQDVSCTPGVLYWPPGSETGEQYWGVDCAITVREIISGA